MKNLILASTVILFISGCPEEHHEQPCDPPCGEFQACIEGVCRDQNCQPPCREGRVCVRGFCIRSCDPDTGDGCGLSETCCADLKACVDTATDYYNCGGCGDACPQVRSNVCSGSRCGCAGYSVNPCGEGFGCCDDGCADLMNDAENCGTCGHSCGGLTCVEGECRCSNDEPCPEGEECCPDGCRDLTTDARNCGRCGYACEEGEDCCNGECVNTLIDVGHCGECGNPCIESEQCCFGTCVDVDTDPFNCGDCLVDCGAGGACSGGTCE